SIWDKWAGAGQRGGGARGAGGPGRLIYAKSPFVCAAAVFARLAALTTGLTQCLLIFSRRFIDLAFVAKPLVIAQIASGLLDLALGLVNLALRFILVPHRFLSSTIDAGRKCTTHA